MSFKNFSIICWNSFVEPDDGERDDGHHRRQDVNGEELIPEHDRTDRQGRESATDPEDLGHVGGWSH